MKYLVNGMLIISLFCFPACKDAGKQPTQKKKTNNVLLQDISLTDLQGKPVDLAQYKGKTVFLNFWATWCMPCLQEMPTIKNAIEKLEGKNIVFLFASDDAPELIAEFKNEHDYPFTYLHLGNFASLNINAIPVTWIYDASGNRVFAEMGYRKWDRQSNIDLLLKHIQ